MVLVGLDLAVPNTGASSKPSRCSDGSESYLNNGGTSQGRTGQEKLLISTLF